jgi:hypothetical protein
MARAPFADWRRLPGDEPPIKARTFIGRAKQEP